MFLSVVIPAFNEERNLGNGGLDEVNEYLKDQDYSWEVFVVDDGSTDKTPLLVEKFTKLHRGFTLVRKSHRGKGATVISGMLEAKGSYVLFTDMDQATPINQLEKVLPKFKEDYDVVIGSREGREGAPIFRKIMAYGFSILRFIVLRLPYKDTQCGFKAFKKEASKAIFSRLKVFKNQQIIKGSAVTAGFDLEILYIARKLGMRVAEVPVDWHYKGTVRVNPIKDSWDGLRDLIKVRINALLGKYGV